MKKKILFIFVCLTIFVSEVSAATTDTEKNVNDARNAVLTTANAYFNQGKQVQYDTYKKNINCTPEDATSKHYCYFNCSGFTYAVYKEALGKEIPYRTEDLLECAKSIKESDKEWSSCNFKNPAGEQKSVKGKVIAYSSDLRKTYDSQESYTKLLSKFLQKNIKSIQPGDLIVWENVNEKRHVMLVQSVEEEKEFVVKVKKARINIIQVGGGDSSTEGRFDLATMEDMFEKDGTVSKAEIILGKRAYLNKATKKNKIKGKMKVAIIRFATSNDTVTESANLRVEYPKLEISKVITKINGKRTNNQTFVKAGETITYALKITNNSTQKTYKNISFKENIDTNNVEVVSVSRKYNDGETNRYSDNSTNRSISSLAPGKSVTIYYTVKVKNEVAVGTIITSTGSVSVDGVGTISSSRIETKVGKGLTDYQKAQIKSNYKTLKETRALNKNINNSIDFVNKLYCNALDLPLNLSSDNIIKYDPMHKKVSQNNDNIKYTSWNDENIKNYLYNNFYGLALIKKNEEFITKVYANKAWNPVSEYELQDRARTLTSDMLETGDIILTKYNGKTVAYVYIESLSEDGESITKVLFSFKKDGETNEKIAQKTSDKVDVFLRNLIGRYYVVLRPYTDGLSTCNTSS